MFFRGQIVCAFIWFLVGRFVNTGGVSAQAQKCGGLFEADKGEIEIEASKSNCLWIIKLQSKTGVSLELKEFTTEAITVIPAQKNSQANFQSSWMVGPEATYTFEGKIFVILASPRNQKVTLSWTGLIADNSVVTLNAKFERSLEGSLEWERKFVHVDAIIWAVEPEGSGEFSWEMISDLSRCEQDNACECTSFGVIHVMPDGRINNNNIHNSCEGSSVGSWKVDKRSLVVIILMDSSMAEGYQLQVTWKCELEPLRKKVTGIAVGTEGGLYIVPSNPTKKTQLSSKWVSGLGFDWNSEKIFWVGKDVGIMRANVDGSDLEQLIADPLVIGLGVESITGNFYYASQSRDSLRVCNNDGKKCSSIIRLSGTLRDMGLQSFKGFLFWSITDDGMFRANLDGSNVTQILQQNSLAIHVNEHADRVYTIWHRFHRIVSYNLDGQDLRTVQNVSIINPNDLAVDDGKLYYNCWTSKTLCSIVKEGTSSTLIAEFPNSTTFLALYGKRLSSPMSNPCEEVKCSHLCVLITASAYRCVCPDGESLQADGISCGI